VDRSGSDALHRDLAGNGTRRRSLLLGGLLSAFGLSRGAEAKSNVTASRKRRKKRAAKLLWAVVDSGGRLAFARGAISAKHGQGNGAYEVVFAQDVSQCAKIAQLQYFSAYGEAYVTQGSTKVSVYTFDTSNGRVAADKSFYLMVTC
jgi:hypothetical protein